MLCGVKVPRAASNDTHCATNGETSVRPALRACIAVSYSPGEVAFLASASSSPPAMKNGSSPRCRPTTGRSPSKKLAIPTKMGGKDTTINNLSVSQFVPTRIRYVSPLQRIQRLFTNTVSFTDSGISALPEAFALSNVVF